MKNRVYQRKTVHNHPYSDKRNRVPLHRHIVEQAIGSFLHPKHVVHHVDGNTRGNFNSNLVACEDQEYHLLIHRRTRAYKACGNPNYRRCPHCETYDDPSVMYIRAGSDSKGARHYDCMNRIRRIY